MTLNSLPERLARGALERAGYSDTGSLPDLAAVAGALAVKQTRLTNGGRAEGETRWTAEGPEIHLAKGQRVGRTKFTFAHELAHVIVQQGAKTNRMLGSIQRQRGHSLERLCDDIAAALILPAEWFRRQDIHDRPRLSELYAISSRADVSLTSVAVRLRYLGTPNILLLLRRTDDGLWFVSSAAGVPAKVRRRIVLDDSVGDFLDGLEDDSIAPYEIAICSGGNAIRRTVDVSRSGQSSLVFLSGMTCSARSNRNQWYFTHVDDHRSVTVDVVDRGADACSIVGASSEPVLRSR